MKRSKYWDTMVDILDAQFPKGKCMERGQAMVMLAYIEMMLNGMKFNEEGKDMRPLDIDCACHQPHEFDKIIHTKEGCSLEEPNESRTTQI